MHNPPFGLAPNAGLTPTGGERECRATALTASLRGAGLPPTFERLHTLCSPIPSPPCYSRRTALRSLNTGRAGGLSMNTLTGLPLTHHSTAPPSPLRVTLHPQVPSALRGSCEVVQPVERGCDPSDCNPLAGRVQLAALAVRGIRAAPSPARANARG